MKPTALLATVLGAVIVALGVAPPPARAAALTVRSGIEIEVHQTLVTSSECTLGAVVSRVTALTAGHCGNVGQQVYNGAGRRVGTIVANRINRGLDIAVIRLAPATQVMLDAIDWSPSLRRGQPVTKFGVNSGFGRGVIIDPTPRMRGARGISLAPPFLILRDTVSVRSSLLARSGDSGSGVRDSSGRVIGIVSAGTETETLVAPVSLLHGHLR
ncbi:MAG: hypothetical protein QM673_06775 [Gordonia sp. (in: high G+C Gram-positive bacteria)]